MRVSDRELLSRIESLARKEQATTAEILLHLNEVERRRLHRTLGDGTMFDLRELNDTPSQVSHSRAGSGTRPRAPEETTVEFAAGPAFVRKLEEARAILSSRSPGLPLEEVLEMALDAFLD